MSQLAAQLDASPQQTEVLKPPVLPAGDPRSEVVYTADSQLRQPATLIRAMFGDLWAARELAWRLFLRDFRAQYRQSFLGYVWIVVPPLVSTLVWVFLNAQSVLKMPDTGMAYPLYVLTGVVLWEGFLAALYSPQQMLAGAASMLTKINFPREALILAGLGQVLFNLGVRLVLLGGVFLWYGFPLPTTALLAPLGILALVLLGLMLGVLLAPLGLLYQDIGRGLTAFTGVWFLLTPVIYPAPTSWPASAVVWANPVSPLLITTRELLTTGELTQVGLFMTVSLTTLIGLFLGWLACRLAMPHLIARMSA